MSSFGSSLRLTIDDSVYKADSIMQTKLFPFFFTLTLLGVTFYFYSQSFFTQRTFEDKLGGITAVADTSNPAYQPNEASINSKSSLNANLETTKKVLLIHSSCIQTNSISSEVETPVNILTPPNQC